MAGWFDRERRTAQRAKDAISALKPLRLNTDSLLREIAQGGERAEQIVALILHTEDLAVALTEVIGEVDALVAQQKKVVQAPPSPTKR